MLLLVLDITSVTSLVPDEHHTAGLQYHQQPLLPCIELYSECTCEEGQDTLVVSCAADTTESVDAISVIFQSLQLSEQHVDVGIDVTAEFGADVGDLPAGLFGNVPVRRCTLYMAGKDRVDLSLFGTSSSTTLQFVHVHPTFTPSGAVVIYFPDYFS
jgi:hypothetical protein